MLMKHVRRRKMESPLAPSVLAARNKEMKVRLSTSSLVLGGVGRETRDWSLSSTLRRHTGFGALDPDLLKKNLATKKELTRAQIVLGEDSPEWGSSNIMPIPTGDISRYRGRLKLETANFIKTSRESANKRRAMILYMKRSGRDLPKVTLFVVRAPLKQILEKTGSEIHPRGTEVIPALGSVKMGSSETGSPHKTSMAREGLQIPDHGASVEIFKSNRSMHNKLRDAGRTTRIIDPDGDEWSHYESSNNMPDLTDRLHEAKSSPEENRELMLRIRRSNIRLGDSRIKTLTTTQHDSMDEVVDATSRMEPGFNARIKQDPRHSSIVLGDGDEGQWTISSAMPNWYSPETYARKETPESRPR